MLLLLTLVHTEKLTIIYYYLLSDRNNAAVKPDESQKDRYGY